MKKNFKVTTKIPEVESANADSELSLFDQRNPDIGFFNMVDDEQIRLSGSKVNYFKFHRSEEYDDVYMEQKNKPIARSPITLYSHYDPKVIEENLTQFGIQLTSDQVFTFNKSYVERRIGRSPIPGDLIQPHFQHVMYEIFEVQEDSFEAYGVYHYVCTAKILRDSPDIQNTPLTDISKELGGVLNSRPD
jgi:hypothetical protein